MKLLYLARHAKSSWKDPSMADHERPLNKRGEHDAPLMARRLSSLPHRPEIIVSSPAVRALRTATVYAGELGYQHADIIVDGQIYLASPGELLEVIHQLDHRCDCAMLVGHNPGMTVLVNHLASATIRNLPTCGIALLGFRVNEWRDVGYNRGELMEYCYPKQLAARAGSTLGVQTAGGEEM